MYSTKYLKVNPVLPSKVFINSVTYQRNSDFAFESLGFFFFFIIQKPRPLSKTIKS